MDLCWQSNALCDAKEETETLRGEGTFPKQVSKVSPLKHLQSASPYITFAAFSMGKKEWGWSGREILKRGTKVSQAATAVFRSQVARCTEGEGTRPSPRRVSQFS